MSFYGPPHSLHYGVPTTIPTATELGTRALLPPLMGNQAKKGNPMADFKSLLNKRIDEAERPPLLPAGVYEGIVRGHKFTETRFDPPTPIVQFAVELSGPSEDIDPEDLMDNGKEIKVQGRRFFPEFSLQEDDLWKLRAFLESCGIEVEGRSFGEAIPDTNNVPVLQTVTVTTGKAGSKNEGLQFNNPGRVTGTENVE